MLRSLKYTKSQGNVIFNSYSEEAEYDGKILFLLVAYSANKSNARTERRRE